MADDSDEHRTRSMTITVSQEVFRRISGLADGANTSASRVFDTILRDGFEYREVKNAKDLAADRLSTAIARAEFLLGVSEVPDCDSLSEAKLIAAALAGQPLAVSYLDVIAAGAFNSMLCRAAWTMVRRVRKERDQAAAAGEDFLPLDPIALAADLMAKPVGGKREQNRMAKVSAELLGMLKELGPAFDSEAHASAHRVVASAAKRFEKGLTSVGETLIGPETMIALTLAAVERGMIVSPPDMNSGDAE